MQPPNDQAQYASLLGVVTEVVWCLPPDMRVRLTLVPIEDEVLIPLLNYGSNSVMVANTTPSPSWMKCGTYELRRGMAPGNLVMVQV